MWGQLAAVIAGAIMDHQKEEEARRQAVAQMYMNYAQQLNPHLNMAPYQAAQLNHQLDMQRGQSTAGLLSKLGGSFIDSKTAGPSLSSPGSTQLSAPSLVSGDYGPGYGYGAPPSFDLPGSDFQLQTPRLLR